MARRQRLEGRSALTTAVEAILDQGASIATVKFIGPVKWAVVFDRFCVFYPHDAATVADEVQIPWDEAFIRNDSTGLIAALALYCGGQAVARLNRIDDEDDPAEHLLAAEVLDARGAAEDRESWEGWAQAAYGDLEPPANEGLGLPPIPGESEVEEN